MCRLKFAVDNSSVDDAQIELHKRRARHLSTTRVAVWKIEALAVLLMSGLFSSFFFFCSCTTKTSPIAQNYAGAGQVKWSPVPFPIALSGSRAKHLPPPTATQRPPSRPIEGNAFAFQDRSSALNPILVRAPYSTTRNSATNSRVFFLWRNSHQSMALKEMHSFLVACRWNQVLGRQFTANWLRELAPSFVVWRQFAAEKLAPSTWTQKTFGRPVWRLSIEALTC